MHMTQRGRQHFANVACISIETTPGGLACSENMPVVPIKLEFGKSSVPTSLRTAEYRQSQSPEIDASAASIQT
jgi:hypothetical protein